MSIDNPFATEEAWAVSTGEYLPKGNHLVKVDSIEFEYSSNNNPTFVIEHSNPQGSKTNWMTVTPNSTGGVVNFTDAVGLDRPGADDIEVDQKSGYTIPKLAYLRKAVGKQVGLVVREEEKWNDPTQKVAKVAGYVTPDRVSGQDVSSANPPSHSPNAPAPTPDIPF